MKKSLSLIILIMLIFPNLVCAVGKDETSMLSWDAKLLPFTDHLEIYLTARNISDQSVKLEFPTSKLYDFSILDKYNKEVFRFSKGKYYLQAFQYVTLKSGEEKSWRVNWDYKNKEKKRIPSGKYTLIARLLPIKVNGIPNPNQWVTKQEFKVPSLHDIQIEGGAGNYRITGVSEVSDEKYFYTVDDGHRIIVNKTAIHMRNDTNTFSVTLQIPENILSQNESIIFSIINTKNQPIFVQSLKK